MDDKNDKEFFLKKKVRWRKELKVIQWNICDNILCKLYQWVRNSICKLSELVEWKVMTIIYVSYMTG